MIAPDAIAKRLTTLVIATSSTFWLKEVIGRHPNTDDNALIKPSQAIEPEVSFKLASRFKPEAASAEVSPIVSVAETRKISVTEIIAFRLNSGLKGISLGKAIIDVPCSAEKSTTPIAIATIYPTISPNNMDELEEAISAMCVNLKKKGITGEEETASSENSEGQAAADEDKKESASSSFIVKNALTYIEENYTQKLTLGEVAEKTYVSQWHLSKLLNRHTGQSFSDILNHTRIEHAKELLKDPSLRIGDISEQVGFLDLAHFSRVFKKQEGVSANEYRNQILGK